MILHIISLPSTSAPAPICRVVRPLDRTHRSDFVVRLLAVRVAGSRSERRLPAVARLHVDDAGTTVSRRSFITLRNQRGYGTQKNWMAVRQELLYYVKGSPIFNVDAEYTDIPKILRGYYKEVNGQITENMQRSRSENIRAGNVWVDVQQVFYRMEENVSGCYAQKPLKSIDRIIRATPLRGTWSSISSRTRARRCWPRKSTIAGALRWTLTRCFARSPSAASRIIGAPAAWAGKTGMRLKSNMFALCRMRMGVPESRSRRSCESQL